MDGNGGDPIHFVDLSPAVRVPELEVETDQFCEILRERLGLFYLGNSLGFLSTILVTGRRSRKVLPSTREDLGLKGPLFLLGHSTTRPRKTFVGSHRRRGKHVESKILSRKVLFSFSGCHTLDTERAIHVRPTNEYVNPVPEPLSELHRS